jgi:Tol biopolymer transport system component
VVAEADGSNPQEVFGDWAALNVWSPTGDRIAFVSNAFVSNGQLHVLDVATGTVTVLVESAGSDFVEVIDFSPEGDRILFSRTEEDGTGTGADSLWSVNVDGSNLRRLFAGTAWGDWLSHSQTG